jgi:hypothetical protein
MNTELTTLLHDRAQRVPTAMHPAADLRRQAERHRRVRRAGAVAAATSAVLVITLAGFLSQAGVRSSAPPATVAPTATESPSPSETASPSETPTATAQAEAPLLTAAEISAALGGCCERLHATRPKAGTGHCLTSPLTTASSPVPARSVAAADNVSLVATETAYAADPTTVTDLLAGVYTVCRQQSGITTAFDQAATSVPRGHLVGIYLPATGVGVMSGGPEQEYAGWAPAGTGTVLVQIVFKGSGEVSPAQLQRLLAAAVSRATS